MPEAQASWHQGEQKAVGKATVTYMQVQLHTAALGQVTQGTQAKGPGDCWWPWSIPQPLWAFIFPHLYSGSGDIYLADGEGEKQCRLGT